MPFLSQGGQIGVKTQAAQGSYMDPNVAGANQGVFVRITGGSMDGNRDLMIPDPEIGGNRDIPDADLGPISYSGDFNAYARMEFIATMVRAALGGASVDTGSALLGWTHTIGTANTIPWLSVEEAVGNGFDVFRYTDCKVNTLHLECDAAGYLMCTFGLVGITQTAGNTASTGANVRFDTSPLLLGQQITVTYNAVQLPAKSFSMDINNNLETDDFRLGSMTLGGVTEKRREITMGCTIRPSDSTLWRQAMYASSAATSPQGGASVKQQAVIAINSFEDIPGANAGVKYNATFTVPKAAIAPYQVTPSGDDVIQNDISIRALRPATATDIITAAIRNSYATVA